MVGWRNSLQNLQSFEGGELLGFHIEAPEFVATENQGRGDVSDIIGAKPVFGRVSLGQGARLLDQIVGRERGGLQAVSLGEIVFELGGGERRLFRRHANAVALAREKHELLERTKGFELVQPGHRNLRLAPTAVLSDPLEDRRTLRQIDVERISRFVSQ